MTTLMRSPSVWRAQGCPRTVILFASSSFLFSTSAFAATPAERSEAVFREAEKLMKDEKYSEACARFEDSSRLDPDALIPVEALAQCREANNEPELAFGKWGELQPRAEAAAAAAAAAGPASAQKAERQKARAERAKAAVDRLLRQHPSSVIVHVLADNRPPTLVVQLDGKAVDLGQYDVAIAKPPGRYSVQASAAEKIPWETNVVVPFGKTVEVNVPVLTDDLAALAFLTVRVSPGSITSGVAIALDDTLLQPSQLNSPIRVEPSKHVVKASAPGRTPWESPVFDTGRGSTKLLIVPDLALLPQKPPPPPPDRPPPAPPKPASSGPLVIGGGVALGVGGVSLITGAIAGAVAASAWSDAHDRCPSRVCPDPTGIDAYHNADLGATVSTVMFAVGGITAAGGIVMVIAGRRSAAPIQPALTAKLAPTLSVSSTGLALTGTF